MIDQKFLEGIGITDENVVKSITETYAADIKAEKDTAAAIQKNLDTANTTIQSYKDMDIDGIKASVEDYKQKWEQSEADRKAFEHKTKLSGYVKGLGLQNDIYESHVLGLLEKSNVQFNDKGELVDVDNVVETFRKSHKDAFKSAEPKPQFVGTAGGSQNTPTDDDFINTILGLK